MYYFLNKYFHHPRLLGMLLSLASWSLTSQRLSPWRIYVYISSHSFDAQVVDPPLSAGLSKKRILLEIRFGFKSAIAIWAGPA